MKKLGIGFGLIIVILMGAILVVPSFLNWNEYKTQIEQTASDFSGRNVKIMGDISLSLLPTTALSVKDVTVTNLDGGHAEYMVSLKSLDVKVSFPSVISSLFGGKVKVEKFILVDPVVALEVLPNGQVNWALGEDATSTENQSSSADISLDKFQIVNGQVSFEDMASGQMELLRKIDANVKITSINGPYAVSGSAKYKGLDAEIDVSLGKNRPGKKVPLSLSLSMLDGQVSTKVIGGVIISGKDSAFAGNLNVKSSDAGQILNVFDRYNGEKSPAVITVGQEFALETVVDASVHKTIISELNMSIGQSRGQGTAEFSLAEKINFLGALSVNKLNLDPLLKAMEEHRAKHPPKKTKAQATGRVPETPTDILNRLSGKFDVKLGALKYNGKIASQIAMKVLAKDGVVDISTLQARMPGGSAFGFTGQITQPDDQKNASPVLTGDVTLNASNLRGLLSWVKMEVSDIPSGQLAQFSYKSGLKLTPDLLQLYGMDGKLDAMRFKGGVSYALEGRPSYGISLDIQNLNIDSYLAKPDPKRPPEKDLKKAFAFLDEFDANYKIDLSNVSLNGMKVRSGHLEGLLLGGNLDAKSIKVTDMAGVTMTASAKGKNFSTKPEMSINVAASAKSLTPLQRALKFESDVDFRKLGAVKLDGTISTSLEKMDIDVKSSIGVNKIDVAGTIRSATLKQFPEIGSANLMVDGSSTSLAALIDQLNLPMTKPMARDDRPVRVKGRLKASSSLVDIDGKLNIAAGEVVVKGRQKGRSGASSLDLTLDMTGAETKEFIRGLGVDFKPSKERLGPFALKVKVTGSGENYTFNNIVGDLGPVKLSGTGKLNTAPKKPIFDLNLKAGEIPLHDFMQKTEKSKNKKTKKEFGQWTRTAMDLSLLSSYEGHAQVSAASLRYNDYVFDNPTFETILKNGVLSVNNFTGRLFGGDVLMSGSFGGTGQPKMAMNITLKKASLTQATKSSAGINPITGFFDMTGQFSSEGGSQYDLMSSLMGNGKITASPGLINGIDLPALSSKLAEMNNNKVFLQLLGTALSGGQTSYKGGESTISANKGKIQFSPFDLELDGAKSKVRMDIDLLNWDIRSNGALSLVDHPNAPPIEVRIAGDVSNPNVIYKTDRLKKYVGAKIASNLLQQLIGGEGGLEGIFGDQKPEQQNGTPPAKLTPEGEAKTPATTTKKPAAKPKPAEEFGKRLLQKLFEKEKKPPPEKETEKETEKEPDNRG